MPLSKKKKKIFLQCLKDHFTLQQLLTSKGEGVNGQCGVGVAAALRPPFPFRSPNSSYQRLHFSPRSRGAMERSSSSVCSSSTEKLKYCCEHKVDKISHLPDPILHHILSFLDMKRIVSTSVLSRRWRYVWASLTTLNFNSDFFCSNLLRFRDFVDQVLLLRDDSHIKRFHVSSVDDCDIENRLNTWILVALKRNVQELSFHIDVDQIFRFPTSLFTCKSLTMLTLQTNGVENSEIVLPDSIDLPSLKTLDLDSFLFCDEKLTNKLFSSCPLLESLAMTNCVFSNMTFIISSYSLKELVLDISYKPSDSVFLVKGKFKLNAPNLECFTFNDPMLTDCSLENFPSLVTANLTLEGRDQSFVERRLNFLRVLHSVKDLTLSQSFLEVISESIDLLDSQSTRFPNLKRLKLHTWLSRDCIHAITYLLKISPNIETLSIEIWQNSAEPLYPYCHEINFNSKNIGDYWEAGSQLEFLLCHLRFMEIRDVLGCVNELKFLEIILERAMLLEKVVVSTFRPMGSSPESDSMIQRLLTFVEKLVAFPRASSSTAFMFS